MPKFDNPRDAVRWLLDGQPWYRRWLIRAWMRVGR